MFNIPTKTCVQCGKQYKPTSNRQKYCGSRKIKNSCAYQIYREYNKRYSQSPKARAYWKKYWQTHSRKLSDKNWRKRYNKPHNKYTTYKRGATTRNLKWELSFKQFITFWRKPCYYCGSAIETIGLDRLDNDKGYLLNNIVACCRTCNLAKRKMTSQQYIAHCKKVAKKWS